MLMILTRFSVCLFTACLLAGSIPARGYAVEIHPKAGTTAASFLKIGIGSRADSMGTAFTGLADDVTALYWNPAGLTQLDRRSLSVTHNESFESIRHDFAGYAWGQRTTRWAGALYGLYIPSELERRSGLNEDDPFEPLTPVEGYFGAYDVCAQVSAARAITPSLSLGVSLKTIQQSIDNLSAFGIGMDAGALYRAPHSRLSLGAAVANIGTPIQFREKSYVLPLALRTGAALRVHGRLTCTADIVLPYDNFPSAAAGIEYKPLTMIALRGGYRYRLHGLELGDLSGMSAGMGVSVPLRGMTCIFDYAFVPYGVLGNSQRISLTILFSDALSPASAARLKPARSDTPAAPPVIAETTSRAPAGAADSDEGFVVASYPLKRTLKRAAGRTVLYAVRGENPAADLCAIAATVPAVVPPDARVDIGWKAGDGTVFRSYRIAAAPARLERVTATIRLPLSLKHPYALTTEGARYPLTGPAASGDTVTYTFALPFLQDFTINHEQ